jgi:hypothetical protein
MKKFYYLITLFIILFFSNCQRFDPPEIKLQMTNQGDSLYSFYGIIIDGGGTEYFNSKGYVYGFSKDPSHIDRESESFEIPSEETDWFLNWSMSSTKHFPIPDTTYYVRGWVRTNAGTGYSNAVRIETTSKKDTTTK